MSKTASEKNIRKQRLKKGLSIDEEKTETVNKNVTEINKLLDDQTEGGDSTGGVITLSEDIFQPTLDEFKELIGECKTKRILSVV